MKLDEIEEYITKSLLILMKDTPFEKITMEKVAVKAGVSRRTIYRYFDNKLQILDTIFKNIVDNYAKKIKDDLNSQGNVLVTSFEFILDYADVFILAYKNNLLDNITMAIKEVVKDIVLHQNKEAKNWSKKYFDCYISFTTGGIYRLLYEWLKTGSDKNPVEVFDVYKNVIADLDKSFS